MITKNDFSGLVLSTELILRQQIIDVLQTDAIELILKEANIEDTDLKWQNIMNEQTVKIDEDISPRLLSILESGIKKLNIFKDVRLLVSSYNGFTSASYYSFNDKRPCYIALNAKLLDVLTESELGFMIGRELGNLIHGNSKITHIVRYLYPDITTISPIIEHKLHIWDQMCETIADWFGYLVCNDFRTCISAILKASYNFSIKEDYFDFDTFVNKVVNYNIDQYRSQEGLSVSSFLINPIRVKILELFSKSISVVNKEGMNIYMLEEGFHKESYELAQLLLKIKKTEVDVHMTTFIASAGLLIANIDGEIDDKEIDLIAYALSDYTLFPFDFIKKFKKEENIEDKLKESLHNIVMTKPNEKIRLFRFMIKMATADNKVVPEEVSFIFEKGKNVFGYTDKEIARLFVALINESQYSFD